MIWHPYDYHLPKLCYSSIIMNDRINDHAHTTLAALSLFQFQLLHHDHTRDTG